MASWSIRYGERMEVVNTSTDGERGCSKEGRSGKGGVGGRWWQDIIVKKESGSVCKEKEMSRRRRRV